MIYINEVLLFSSECRYNLTAIRVPIVLYAGKEDYLADPADVDTLAAQLAPGVLVKRVDVASYAHLDFTWAVDANTVVYEDLMAVLATAHSSSL